MEFALCMQTDLRCLGIVILQIFIKRVFQQKELNFWKSWKSLRVQDDHKIDDSKVEQGSNDRLTSSEEEEQVWYLAINLLQKNVKQFLVRKLRKRMLC